MVSTTAAVTAQTRGAGHWSSHLVFVMAVAGAAAGLGNLWVFPYLVGRHGGGAFVLVYLGCVFMVGVPVLVAALSLGRLGGADPAPAFACAVRRRRHAWSWAGQFLTLSAFVVLTFYSVAAGWTLDYAWLCAHGRLTTSLSDPVGTFAGLVTNPARSLATLTVFIGLTAAVLAAGVREGLDRAIRWLMPVLIAMIVALVLYAAATSDGFSRALEFLFTADFTRLTADGMLAALGQALFTLSVAAGGMICYGAYAGDGTPIARSALAVALIASAMSLLAVLVVLSFTFAAGLGPAMGPRLLFVTLPAAFAGLSGGWLVGTVFFLFASLAALTSAFALLEPVVNAMARRACLSRRAATLLAAFTVWLAGVVLILSLDASRSLSIVSNPSHAALETLVSYWMLPVGVLLVALTAGWAAGCDPLARAAGLADSRWLAPWRFALRWLAPLASALLLARACIA